MLKIETMMPAMRLIGWCRNIDQSCVRNFRGIFKASLMRSLLGQGYIRPYTENYGWRLTAKGYKWLSDHGYPMKQDLHTQNAARRFEHAAVVVTMYAAGISPFQSGVEDFSEQGGYLPAFALRARCGQDSLGSNQVVGFLRLGKRMLAVHYPHPERKIILQREYDCAERMMLRSGCTDLGFLFCGQSYASIYRSLVNAETSDVQRKKRSYASLFSQSRFAFLLPCDGLGALQLQLMSLPDYRLQIGAVLGERAGQMSALDMPDCDFIDSEHDLPVRLMLDMELCRVENAAWQAKEAGYPGLVLAAFEEQVSFLEQLFPPPFYHIAAIPGDLLEILEGGAAHAPAL